MKQNIVLDYKAHITDVVFRERDNTKIQAHDFINTFTDLIIDFSKKEKKEGHKKLGGKTLMKKTVEYIRENSDKSPDNLSIEAQIKQIKEYCQKNNIQLIETYTKGLENGGIIQ